MATTLDDLLGPHPEPQVLGNGYGFCEGPAADAQGTVYFSDGRNDSIYRYRSGEPVRLFVGDSTDANGMMFNTRGELYVCEGAARRVVALDVHTKRKRVLASQLDALPFNEPNDLAIDHSDGFYFSDPNYQHRGQPTLRKEDVYYCSPQGEITRVSTVCFRPNGVLLAPEDRCLYLADSTGQRIFRYDVSAPGNLVNETLWISGLHANPDGMTLDELGNLYVCLGKGGIKVFDPQRQLIGVVRVDYASNCCFGAGDFQTLFITSVDKLLGIRTQVGGIKPRCWLG